MTICEFRRVCAILRPEKKQAAVGVGSAVRLNNRAAKGDFVMHYSKLTMPMAWLQYSDHPLVGFCDILKALTNPINQTGQSRAGNASLPLTINYTGGSHGCK